MTDDNMLPPDDDEIPASPDDFDDVEQPGAIQPPKDEQKPGNGNPPDDEGNNEDITTQRTETDAGISLRKRRAWYVTR
jgi:hypothetical protein